MKAIVHHKYGSPDDIELREIDKSVVADDEVLIRVRASFLRILEWHSIMELAIARIGGGLCKPKNARLGVDFAGVIASSAESR